MSANKITSKVYPNNPVSADQLIELGVDATCLSLTSEDLECGGMSLLLQALIDRACATTNYNVSCLTADQNTESVVQALIDKVCELG